jgi:hypothetical protein
MISPMMEEIKRAHLEYMVKIAAIAADYIPTDELERTAQELAAESQPKQHNEED